MPGLVFLSVLLLLLQRPLSSLANSEVLTFELISRLLCRRRTFSFQKRSLNDHNNLLNSWDPTLDDPCTWFHVTCDSNTNVIHLDLGHSNISRTLGPELGQLPYLQYLELYGNKISGKIPVELGKLKYLISFDLSYNQLEGNIPVSFGLLKSLKFLRLNNNNLSGTIPREVTQLTLIVFNFSNNHLPKPPVYGNFKSFSLESFENNKFSGPELKGLLPCDSSDCKEETIFT